MESSPVRTLFKTIMKGQEPPAVRDLEVINLIYPVTMEEITVPVRNRGCAQARVCVWPLDSLMKQAQEDAGRGSFRETSEDLSSSYFTCKMCSEDTKFAKRSYHDFYYDRKLDYLIRAAKGKYFDSFRGEFDLERDGRARERVERTFKHSKLYIHRGGGVILEYKKKILEGVKVTYRAVVFEDTLSHYSEQLVFNPKDYSKNLSALKIAQNLTQRRIGDRIDRGFQEVSATYSKKYQEQLQRILSDWIIDYVVKHTRAAKKEELYAAKVTANQSLQRKNFELILFYPRYNLTQIYTFDEREDIIASCGKDTIRVCSLAGHQLLLYTADYTYVLQLEPAKASLQRNQVFSFKRPIEVKDQDGEALLSTTANVDVKYLKQWECYHKCPEKYVKFDSVRPLIDAPVLLVNPLDPQEAFVFGGTIQGINNHFVYRLEQGKWARQKEELKWTTSRLQLIVEGPLIFALAFEQVGKEKESSSRLVLHELEVRKGEDEKGELRFKQTYDLGREIKSNCLLPLRAKDNEYILADLSNKQPPLCLDLERRQLVGRAVKDDISRFMKQLYDIRNQRSIFYSYPACSVTHNQVNYNILSNSIAKHTFKILYGCGDEWMLSDLSQALLHD